MHDAVAAAGAIMHYFVCQQLGLSKNFSH
jgi:hypothetical protein